MSRTPLVAATSAAEASRACHRVRLAVVCSAKMLHPTPCPPCSRAPVGRTPEIVFSRVPQVGYAEKLLTGAPKHDERSCGHGPQYGLRGGLGGSGRIARIQLGAGPRRAVGR